MQSTANTLPVHRAVMAAAGPEALAGISRSLNDREHQLLNAWAARVDGATDDELRELYGPLTDTDLNLIRTAIGGAL